MKPSQHHQPNEEGYKVRKLVFLVVVAAFMALAISGTASAAPPLSGAIFTTNLGCTGVDLNIYDAKGDVYVDGGPAHTGAASLPDGAYYVQVTDPSGAIVLGSSVNMTTQKPFVVLNGEPVECYQLEAIVGNGGVAGYNDTPNAGGEYKVWISNESSFTNNSTKTDNFKVNADEPPPPPNPAHLNVIKFYDANADGDQDAGEPELFWRVHIFGAFEDVEFTPVDKDVDPGTYTVTEDNAQSPPTWLATTRTSDGPFTLGEGESHTTKFGNVCLGAGGGLTLGFWSNRNGQALIDSTDLSMLAGLNLRNADGSNFDPTTYAALRTWLLNGTAVNMAYMLSVQLAAMELNVFNNKVSGSALVYTGSGFVTINALMAAANAALGDDGETLAGDPNRAAQEALKNTLDSANNNANFVQANPCAYTFAPLS
jgi:hypothetical protein